MREPENPSAENPVDRDRRGGSGSGTGTAGRGEPSTARYVVSRRRDATAGASAPAGVDGLREAGDRPAEASPEEDGVVDPVKAAYAGEEDLYDVATWEARGSLDAFAVAVTRGLRSIRSRLLLATALALFLAQLVVAGALVIERPVFGVLAALSVVPALVVALTLWYWDPTTREPVELLAATFLLSMLFAGFAGVVNSFLLPVFELFGVAGIVLAFFIVVGPIVVKGLLIAVFIHGSYNTLVTVLPLSAVASLGVPPGLAFVLAVVTFHAFWFGLLYRKVLQYRTYYETVERPVR